MENPLNYAGKVALVTGAGSGLGLAIAQELASRGARVYGADLAHPTPGAIGGSSSDHVIDLRDEDAVQALAAQIDSESGRLDIVVNAAGGELSTKDHLLPKQHPGIEHQDLGNWRDLFDVNITTMMLVSKHTVPLMYRGGYGRVVNLSSGAATGTSHGGVSRAYSAAKAGVNVLTRHLAREVGAHGEITVNAIIPGLIVSSERLRASWDTRTPEEKQWFYDRSALGRLATVEEIVSTTLFLTSDMSSGMTGQLLWVNAGAQMTS